MRTKPGQKMSTTALPNYVKMYFGGHRKISMVKTKKGFKFSGDNKTYEVHTNSADTARRHVRKYVADELDLTATDKRVQFDL